mmetsp:Transcript_68610/g.146878  ORF Transcript_68610/g.146878 Transcript_68610/m.146878 type:complete len:301 (+) Transcript_68610:110-1012(+)
MDDSYIGIYGGPRPAGRPLGRDAQEVGEDAPSRDRSTGPWPLDDEGAGRVALRGVGDNVVSVLCRRKGIRLRKHPQLHRGFPCQNIDDPYVAQDLSLCGGLLHLLRHLCVERCHGLDEAGCEAGGLLLLRRHPALQRLRHQGLHGHIVELELETAFPSENGHFPLHIRAAEVVTRVGLCEAELGGLAHHLGEGRVRGHLVEEERQCAAEDTLDALDRIAGPNQVLHRSDNRQACTHSGLVKEAPTTCLDRPDRLCVPPQRSAAQLLVRRHHADATGQPRVIQFHGLLASRVVNDNPTPWL